MFPTDTVLTTYFKTDDIRNFIYTKHNGDNAKLRISSFIPQRQRIQPNFMNHPYQTTYQTNTTRTTRTTTSTLVSPLTQSLCSYNWENANSGVFILKTHNISTNFVHFIHTNLCTSSIPKNLWTIDYEQFRTFHLSPHESVTGCL